MAAPWHFFVLVFNLVILRHKSIDSLVFRRRDWMVIFTSIRWHACSSICLISFLKFVSFSNTFLETVFFVYFVVPDQFHKHSRNSLLLFLSYSTIANNWVSHIKSLWCYSDVGSVTVIDVVVSVANKFVQSSVAADYGYHTFGELARFIYCLLQKLKKSSSLPFVHQGEE